jgi:hypothetical protein
VVVRNIEPSIRKMSVCVCVYGVYIFTLAVLKYWNEVLKCTSLFTTLFTTFHIFSVAEPNLY